MPPSNATSVKSVTDSLCVIESELRRLESTARSSNTFARIRWRIELLRRALHCEDLGKRDALLRKALAADSEVDGTIPREVAPVDPMKLRTAKMADAAWSMRAKGLRFTDPELRKYDEKHVAVFEQRIVAYGDDYTEVLHRAMAECGVPFHRIIMSHWSNPATLQTVDGDEDV